MTAQQGILEIRRTVSSGAATPVEIVEAAYRRAIAAQPRIKAFSYLPEVLKHAMCEPSAPLAGIAVAVKDLMDTADMPTAYGSPIYADRLPARDARMVERLRALGATVLGKSVTTEFAWRHPGPTLNPWNLGHTPGGSSSGSAAAVAAGIVPLALGTQTYGSVIRPAAFCGVVGLKPTYGTLSRAGIHPLAGSLDHVGLFTRSVGDAAYALALLAGADASDPHGTAPIPFGVDALGERSTPPRIGILQGEKWEAIDACQLEVLGQSANRFAAAGAELVTVALPPAFDKAWRIAATILAVEAADIHGAHAAQRPMLLSGPLRELVLQGRHIAAPDYLAARRAQAALQEQFGQWFATQGLDALLAPPASGEAPGGLDSTGNAAYCTPFSLLGVPAITLPAGFGPHGLPLGLQLIGTSRADLPLLRVAHWCETVLGPGAAFPVVEAG